MLMSLQESGEMYLETILKLSQEKIIVKSIDLAKAMNFTKPSISRAMTRLKEQGYIEIGEHGALLLTKEGMDIATAIYDRHLVLTKLLISFGVDEKNSEVDACRMEHVISDTTFQCLKQYLEQKKQE